MVEQRLAVAISHCNQNIVIDLWCETVTENVRDCFQYPPPARVDISACIWYRHTLPIIISPPNKSQNTYMLMIFIRIIDSVAKSVAAYSFNMNIFSNVNIRCQHCCETIGKRSCREIILL